MGRPVKTDEQRKLDKRIGQRLKIIRQGMRTKEGKKVTQEDFAKMFNYSIQCIRYWEGGKRTVPEDVLECVAKNTSIDIEYLKCEVDDPHFQENLNKQFSEWNTQLKPIKAEIAFIDLLNQLEIDYSVLSSKQRQEFFKYIKEQIIFKYQQMKGE